MKLFEITSGFIAAVLIALGAYQYVNTTTVEEEPVVKEVSTQISYSDKVEAKMLSLPWHFTGGLGDSPTEADNYQSGSTDDCPLGSATVCELNAPADGSGKPNMKATVQIGNETQTIEQRIADAIANGPNETVTSLRAN